MVITIFRLKIERAAMAGLYLHIPFCVSKCFYCDFYSCTLLDKRSAFIEAMLREMYSRRDYLNGETIRTIYFGGGTPSLLSSEQISRLLDAIRATFDLKLEEVTLEANPDDITPAYLAALSDTGINRLSIGIQSFDDHDLRLMNRRHTSSQAIEAIRQAQKHGFDNISGDLIFGIPGMNEERWRYNIGQMLSLGIQHISAYHLSIEEGTPFASMVQRGSISPVDEDTSEREYNILCEMLGDAGYEHYEISNFALPGYRARHNSAYWQGIPYLGLGPSAHSYNGTQRQWCVADTERYISESPSSELFDSEYLTPDDIYNEYIMVRLRCADGIELADMENKFGREIMDEFYDKAKKLISSGLMQNKDGHISVIPERFLISDRIISYLFNV